MDIIKALKENKTVYILLSKAEQDFIKRTPLKNFICLQDEQAQRGEVVWDNQCTDEFFNDGQDESAQAVLRLRPDYEEIKFPDKVFASTGDAEQGPNYVVGVTAHCKCGHVFTDDVVHCKPELKGIVDVRSSDTAYAEKPEIVECEVYRDSDSKSSWLCFKRKEVETKQLLHCAVNHPDFIGFKYEDTNNIVPHPRMYVWQNSGDPHAYMLSEHIKSGKSEVLTPTHVLFQRSK